MLRNEFLEVCKIKPCPGGWRWHAEGISGIEEAIRNDNAKSLTLRLTTAWSLFLLNRSWESLSCFSSILKVGVPWYLRSSCWCSSSCFHFRSSSLECTMMTSQHLLSMASMFSTEDGVMTWVSMSPMRMLQHKRLILVQKAGRSMWTTFSCMLTITALSHRRTEQLSSFSVTFVFSLLRFRGTQQTLYNTWNYQLPWITSFIYSYLLRIIER